MIYKKSHSYLPKFGGGIDLQKFRASHPEFQNVSDEALLNALKVNPSLYNNNPVVPDNGLSSNTVANNNFTGLVSNTKIPDFSAPNTTKTDIGETFLGDKQTSAASSGANYGNISAGINAAATLGTAAIDKFDNYTPYKDYYGNTTKVQSNTGATIKGGLQGAALGANPALATATGGLSIVAGAALGGIYGSLTQKSQERKAKRELEASNNKFSAEKVSEAQNKVNSLNASGWSSKGTSQPMFKLGGYLKYPEGGKVKEKPPIYTTDPNDPRLRAYNDSLKLFNSTEYFKTIGEFNPDITKGNTGRYYLDYLPKKNYEKFTPIGTRAFKGENDGGEYLINEFPVYKKPVQPVVYQKPQPTTVTKLNTTTNTKPVISNTTVGTAATTGYNAAMAGMITPTTQNTQATPTTTTNTTPTMNLNGLNLGSNGNVYDATTGKAIDPSDPRYSAFLYQHKKTGNFSPTDLYYIRKNIPTFAKGGNIPPEYEVEKDEVIQGNDTQLEEQQDLASDITKAGGETHENGGTLGSGGERVFSDRITIDPSLLLLLKSKGVNVKNDSTYAAVAEKLGKLKGKFESKLISPNNPTRQTGEVMTERINKLLDDAFNAQEVTKQLEEQEEMKFKLGGYIKGKSKLPKYDNGAELGKSLLKYSKDNFGQLANFAAYSENVNDINKLNTNINRTTPTPVFTTAPKYLGKALNEINTTQGNIYKSIDNTSASIQDIFARKAAIAGETLKAKNDAITQQGLLEAQIANQNAGTANQFNILKSSNANQDALDKLENKNAIIANKIGARNTLIQGYMGNVASKRAYDNDKFRMILEGMKDSDRGVYDRTNDKLIQKLKDAGLDDTQISEFLDAMGNKKAYGGKISNKSMIKGYC